MLQTGVWGAQALWFLGPAKLMRLRRLPDALSISYGYCERLADKVSIAGVRLLDAMFVRLGLAGVGVFGSAGDSGSTCDGHRILARRGRRTRRMSRASAVLGSCSTVATSA